MPGTRRPRPPRRRRIAGIPELERALLADEDGIEQLIERLEDLSEETGWDA